MSAVWQSQVDDDPGLYLVAQEATNAYGERESHSASFAMLVPSEHKIYLPLVVKNHAGVGNFAIKEKGYQGRQWASHLVPHHLSLATLPLAGVGILAALSLVGWRRREESRHPDT